MTDMDEGDTRKKEGSAGRPAKLELKKPVEANQVRQNFPHGRSKLVTVEVRKKRTFSTDNRGRSGDGRGDRSSGGRGGDSGGRDSGAIGLTSQEKLARARALQDARRAEEERPAPLPPPPRTVAKEAPEPETPPVVETPVTEPTVKPAAVEAKAPDAPVETTVEQDVQPAETAATPTSAEEKPSKEADGVQAKATPETAELVTPVPETALATEGTLAATEPVAEDAKSATSAPAKTSAEPAKAGGAARKPATPAKKGGEAPRSLADAAAKLRGVEGEEDDGGARGRSRRPARSSGPKAPSGAGRRDDASARRGGRLSLSDALDEGGGERMRSLASVRRARQKEKMKLYQSDQEANKIVRDVTIPETITVQELANRMAERSTDVIKSLMRMGVMATINHAIDADTAELIATEFGHNVKRVSETDVELGLHGEEDNESDLKPRPPVVTVMGHVDHGKTSLLDALRRTDVAAHEAGGITQHIGAYQVTLASGAKITFIDTPGHEAFTQMRARGAKATDIVILVVAADDGVMPQTVEAIAHATAAGVPIIVAVNKIDRPDADPGRIRTNLLQHGIVVEEMGGETLCVDVSAKQGTNLDKLAEAILLQAEVLDLRANPDRPAEGVVIETKIERGRGPVATILVQRGTLRVGDIFVAGSEWGRVRGLMDANGAILTEAGPGMPVEILGLDGTPAAGDDVVVVNNEARAREVAEFRQRRQRDARTTMVRGSLEQFMSRIQEGEAKELSLVIKADVHGSGEAITTSLERLGTDEVKVRVLHSGVGGINESDVTLARASNALIIGFNVRANPQARELAKRDGVEIRYYSIIYDLIDDAKKLLTGMLAPKLRENLLGYAEIRQVFAISKVGKVAGCMVTEGMVKRGGKVRLLRDNVVIHEGELGQLKRFKDDVKEVKEGYDCGISLANYQDIQVGDMIECFEIEEIAQQL